MNIDRTAAVAQSEARLEVSAAVASFITQAKEVDPGRAETLSTSFSNLVTTFTTRQIDHAQYISEVREIGIQAYSLSSQEPVAA